MQACLHVRTGTRGRAHAAYYAFFVWFGFGVLVFALWLLLCRQRVDCRRRRRWVTAGQRTGCGRICFRGPVHFFGFGSRVRRCPSLAADAGAPAPPCPHAT
jgi:hypothetical protein